MDYKSNYFNYMIGLFKVMDNVMLGRDEYVFVYILKRYAGAIVYYGDRLLRQVSLF